MWGQPVYGTEWSLNVSGYQSFHQSLKINATHNVIKLPVSCPIESNDGRWNFFSYVRAELAQSLTAHDKRSTLEFFLLCQDRVGTITDCAWQTIDVGIFFSYVRAELAQSLTAHDKRSTLEFFLLCQDRVGTITDCAWQTIDVGIFSPMSGQSWHNHWLRMTNDRRWNFFSYVRTELAQSLTAHDKRSTLEFFLLCQGRVGTITDCAWQTIDIGIFSPMSGQSWDNHWLRMTNDRRWNFFSYVRTELAQSLTAHDKRSTLEFFLLCQGRVGTITDCAWQTIDVGIFSPMSGQSWHNHWLRMTNDRRWNFFSYVRTELAQSLTAHDKRSTLEFFLLCQDRVGTITDCAWQTIDVGIFSPMSGQSWHNHWLRMTNDRHWNFFSYVRTELAQSLTAHDKRSTLEFFLLCQDRVGTITDCAWQTIDIGIFSPMSGQSWGSHWLRMTNDRHWKFFSYVRTELGQSLTAHDKDLTVLPLDVIITITRNKAMNVCWRVDFIMQKSDSHKFSTMLAISVQSVLSWFVDQQLFQLQVCSSVLRL